MQMITKVSHIYGLLGTLSPDISNRGNAEAKSSASRSNQLTSSQVLLLRGLAFPGGCPKAVRARGSQLPTPAGCGTTTASLQGWAGGDEQRAVLLRTPAAHSR